jgi:hypothetical protein
MIDCIVSQQWIGYSYPITFHSKKMELAERNYNIHNKELLAVVAAFKHWYPYCYSIHCLILVYPDHQNLQ